MTRGGKHHGLHLVDYHEQYQQHQAGIDHDSQNGEIEDLGMLSLIVGAAEDHADGEIQAHGELKYHKLQGKHASAFAHRNPIPLQIHDLYGLPARGKGGDGAVIAADHGHLYSVAEGNTFSNPPYEQM